MKKSLLTILAVAASMTVAAQETVYFSEDFEAYKDYTCTSDKGQTPGNTIGDNNLDVYCPFFSTPKNADEQTIKAALEAKGFSFIRINKDGNTNPGECIYWNTNYLKFGKSGFQGGIVLPAVEVPVGETAVLEFDWTPMRQGSGVWDPTVIKIIAGDKTFEAPAANFEEGAAMQWIHAKIELAGAAINAENKITIRPNDANWGVKSQHRWFIDNIKLSKASSSGIEGIVAEDEAPVEYYNLQGIRVAEPTNGLYIRRQGNKATKVVF